MKFFFKNQKLEISWPFVVSPYSLHRTQLYTAPGSTPHPALHRTRLYTAPSSTRKKNANESLEFKAPSQARGFFERDLAPVTSCNLPHAVFYA